MTDHNPDNLHRTRTPEQKRKIRREVFLVKMNQLISWGKLEKKLVK
jgi:hypothetical protein